MSFVSKTTGALSVVSCIHDIHKTALFYSNKEYAKVSSDRTITTSVNTQKADNFSYKDAQRKNWHNQSDFIAPYADFWGKATGYCKGLGKGFMRYFPNFICSAFALFSHTKLIANSAAVLLALIEGVDFVKNTFGIGQRDDYLK